MENICFSLHRSFTSHYNCINVIVGRFNDPGLSELKLFLLGELLLVTARVHLQELPEENRLI